MEQPGGVVEKRIRFVKIAEKNSDCKTDIKGAFCGDVAASCGVRD